MKISISIYCSIIIMLSFTFITCTSDPFLPAGAIVDPGQQNPGETNLCPPGVISFQFEVLPLMVSNCAFSGCHDAQTAEDDIVLDSYDNIMKEVSPGDPNNSELYESIIETDPDDIMPPPPYQPLTTEQITLVRDWINQGAQNTNCGTPCDPQSASFSTDIMPVLTLLCIGCHNTTSTQGNINLESYEHVKPYALDGSLLGCIKFEPSYAAMPPSGGKMSDCHIGQIEKWINEGALDN